MQLHVNLLIVFVRERSRRLHLFNDWIEKCAYEVIYLCAYGIVGELSIFFCRSLFFSQLWLQPQWTQLCNYDVRMTLLNVMFYVINKSPQCNMSNTISHLGTSPQCIFKQWSCLMKNVWNCCNSILCDVYMRSITLGEALNLNFKNIFLIIKINNK